MRGRARHRARHLRALLSGVSVRDLGGQDRARGDGLRHVRNRGPGVTAAGASPDLRDFSGLLVLVGAGKMGGALLEGWLRLGLDPGRIAVLEPVPAPQVAVLAARGLRLNLDPNTLGAAGLILNALKPQVAAQALPALSPLISISTVVVSI